MHVINHISDDYLNKNARKIAIKNALEHKLVNYIQILSLYFISMPIIVFRIDYNI